MCSLPPTPRIRLSPRSRSAFSLTELTMVMFMVSCTALLAMFGYRHNTEVTGREGAVIQWVQTLRAARAQAVGASAPVQLALDTDAGRLTAWCDLNTNGITECGEACVTAMPASAGIAVSANATNGFFNPMGQFRGSGDRWAIRLTHEATPATTIYVVAGGEVGWTHEPL